MRWSREKLGWNVNGEIRGFFAEPRMTLKPCLDPSADYPTRAADHLEAIGTVGEETRVDFRRADVFEGAECGEFCSDLWWRKEELKGFAGYVDARG